MKNIPPQFKDVTSRIQSSADVCRNRGDLFELAVDMKLIDASVSPSSLWNDQEARTQVFSQLQSWLTELASDDREELERIFALFQEASDKAVDRQSYIANHLAHIGSKRRVGPQRNDRKHIDLLLAIQAAPEQDRFPLAQDLVHNLRQRSADLGELLHLINLVCSIYHDYQVGYDGDTETDFYFDPQKECPQLVEQIFHCAFGKDLEYFFQYFRDIETYPVVEKLRQSDPNAADRMILEKKGDFLKLLMKEKDMLPDFIDFQAFYHELLDELLGKDYSSVYEVASQTNSLDTMISFIVYFHNLFTTNFINNSKEFLEAPFVVMLKRLLQENEDKIEAHLSREEQSIEDLLQRIYKFYRLATKMEYHRQAVHECKIDYDFVKIQIANSDLIKRLILSYFEDIQSFEDLNQRLSDLLSAIDKIPNKFKEGYIQDDFKWYIPQLILPDVFARAEQMSAEQDLTLIETWEKLQAMQSQVSSHAYFNNHEVFSAWEFRQLGHEETEQVPNGSTIFEAVQNLPFDDRVQYLNRIYPHLFEYANGKNCGYYLMCALNLVFGEELVHLRKRLEVEPDIGKRFEYIKNLYEGPLVKNLPDVRKFLNPLLHAITDEYLTLLSGQNFDLSESVDAKMQVIHSIPNTSVSTLFDCDNIFLRFRNKTDEEDIAMDFEEKYLWRANGIPELLHSMETYEERYQYLAKLFISDSYQYSRVVNFAIDYCRQEMDEQFAPADISARAKHIKYFLSFFKGAANFSRRAKSFELLEQGILGDIEEGDQYCYFKAYLVDNGKTLRDYLKFGGNFYFNFNATDEVIKEFSKYTCMDDLSL